MTTRKENDGFTTALIIAGFPTLVFGFIVMGLVVGAWGAFVVWKLYGWFFVTLGAPVINWWHMWGLMLIIGYFTFKEVKPDPDATMPDVIGKIVGRVLGLGFTLLLGWIIYRVGVA